MIVKIIINNYQLQDYKSETKPLLRHRDGMSVRVAENF